VDGGSLWRWCLVSYLPFWVTSHFVSMSNNKSLDCLLMGHGVSPACLVRKTHGIKDLWIWRFFVYDRLFFFSLSFACYLTSISSRLQYCRSGSSSYRQELDELDCIMNLVYITHARSLAGWTCFPTTPLIERHSTIGIQ
jgi:hypothetical protein